MQRIEIEQNREIYSVTGLNNEVRYLLEGTYSAIWVEGEISNFSAPHSGHWYFTLKDSAAQVRCAMFKGQQRRLDFSPKDGMHVLLRARVSLYPNRGDYQLIAELMEERGAGKLRRAYEVLKNKLEAAGLFADEHKKPLPSFPKQIGVITSATGAAIRDILTVLKRRFPSLPVIVYPTLVQGASAAPAIVRAIHKANQRDECDVLIVARGGGSLEDLWSFNEEIVAQAIFHSCIPIISGVGHEVDFTIADFVADVRAPTPSAAAEIVSADGEGLLKILARQLQQMTRHMSAKVNSAKNHLEWVQKHLLQQHPKRRLVEKMQRLDFYELALVQLQNNQLSQWRKQLFDLDTRLQKRTPRHFINQVNSRLDYSQQQFRYLMTTQISNYYTTLSNAAAKLDALSPLATLARGYAIATHAGQIVRDATTVQAGDRLELRLMNGSVDCVVSSTTYSAT